MRQQEAKIDHLRCYGTDAAAIEQLAVDNPKLAFPLHEKLPYQEAEVVWATKYEMARTVEDVLARRTRSLLLDARASNEAALKTAQIMAEQLGYNQAWVDSQIASYKALSSGYLLVD